MALPQETGIKLRTFHSLNGLEALKLHKTWVKKDVRHILTLVKRQKSFKRQKSA